MSILFLMFSPISFDSTKIDFLNKIYKDYMIRKNTCGLSTLKNINDLIFDFN